MDWFEHEKAILKIAKKKFKKKKIITKSHNKSPERFKKIIKEAKSIIDLYKP